MNRVLAYSHMSEGLRSRLRLNNMMGLIGATAAAPPPHRGYPRIPAAAVNRAELYFEAFETTLYLL